MHKQWESTLVLSESNKAFECYATYHFFKFLKKNTYTLTAHALRVHKI